MKKRMKKWSVIGIVSAQKYLGEFVAETEEEAIEMALGGPKNYFSMCHQCSDNFELNEHTCQEAIAEEVK